MKKVILRSIVLNPRIFLPSMPVFLIDTILLGEIGIWPITHKDSNNILWCGGMKTDLKHMEMYNKIFKSDFIDWLHSLTDNIHIGDTLVGYNDTQEVTIVVDSVYPTSTTNFVSGVDPKGYTLLPSLILDYTVIEPYRDCCIFDWLVIK